MCIAEGHKVKNFTGKYLETSGHKILKEGYRAVARKWVGGNPLCFLTCLTLCLLKKNNSHYDMYIFGTVIHPAQSKWKYFIALE